MKTKVLSHAKGIKRASGTSVDIRIEHYLAKCPAAISGQHGHDQTFKVACALVWGFALPADRALLYLEIYNEKCRPRWSASELEHKITSALKTPPRGKPVGYLRCFKRR